MERNDFIECELNFAGRISCWNLVKTPKIYYVEVRELDFYFIFGWIQRARFQTFFFFSFTPER